MPSTNYSLSEVATLLGKKPYQITYLITTGKIPEVKRFAGRRQFSPSDVRRLRRHFATKTNKETNEIQETNDESP
jgi:DNA-binding transcriptional MerR regulator